MKLQYSRSKPPIFSTGVLSVGFSIKREALVVGPSAPHGAHRHADVIFLLGSKKDSKDLAVLPGRPRNLEPGESL